MIHAYKCLISSDCEEDCLTRSTLSSDTRGRPALFSLQRHPVVWNCWYQRLMLLGDVGSLLNCRPNARWTETTDSCFTNCSTQNAFCSGVAIFALLRHRSREKRGVVLRMRTKLKHLLFCSMWETYFCVRFESRNGRLKLLQSFWSTLYMENTIYELIVQIWHEERISLSWVEALICPIHKQGEVQNGENFRGILLVNIVFKVLSIVLYMED